MELDIKICSACNEELEYWRCPNGPDCNGCQFGHTIQDYPAWFCPKCNGFVDIEQSPLTNNEIKKLRKLLNENH